MRRNGRFRWSRRTYRQAHQLSRLLARYMDLPDHPPAILRRYWELWERHRNPPDPLATPLHRRLDYFRRDSDIPF